MLKLICPSVKYIWKCNQITNEVNMEFKVCLCIDKSDDREQKHLRGHLSWLVDGESGYDGTALVSTELRRWEQRTGEGGMTTDASRWTRCFSRRHQPHTSSSPPHPLHSTTSLLAYWRCKRPPFNYTRLLDNASMHYVCGGGCMFASGQPWEMETCDLIPVNYVTYIMSYLFIYLLSFAWVIFSHRFPY